MNRRWKIAQAAEIRWWKSYLKDKNPDDYLAKKRLYWLKTLRELDFHLEKGTSVLDAGCGPAGIFLILKDHQVVAIDPLLLQYEKDIQHFSQSQFPWVAFQPETIEGFNSPKQFDTVFCLNVINHVADLQSSLDNLIRLTKTGGDLIITVDAHNHHILKKIFQIIPGDILHPQQYSQLDYCAMFRERKCEIHKSQKLKHQFIFDYWAFWLKKSVVNSPM